MDIFTESGKGTDDLIDNIKALHKACPDYHATVLNTSCKVNERTGRATVWILQVVDGLPDGFRRESVNELTWIKIQGEWYCTKHRGLRGLCSGFASEDGG